MGCIPADRTHASKVKQRWLLGPTFPRAGSPTLRELTHSLQGKGKTAVNICVLASCQGTVGEGEPLGQDMTSVKVTLQVQTRQLGTGLNPGLCCRAVQVQSDCVRRGSVSGCVGRGREGGVCGGRGGGGWGGVRREEYAHADCKHICAAVPAQPRICSA